MGFDLSVVVFTQDEELCTFHTLKSVKSAIELAKDTGINCEVVLSLSQANTETEIRSYAEQDNIYFKDLLIICANSTEEWERKNYGAQAAHGKYVTFINCGDFMSRQWLMNAFRLAESISTPSIIHPKYEVSFDADKEVIENIDDNDIANFALLSGNAYSSFYLIKRDLFLQIKNKSDNFPQYRDYDWAFNCKVSNAGIKHYCAEETAWFVRQQDTPFFKLRRDKALDLFLQRRSKCVLDVASFPTFKIAVPAFSYAKAFTAAIFSRPICMLSKNLRPLIVQFYLNSIYFNNCVAKGIPSWLIDEIIFTNLNIDPLIQSRQYKRVKINSQMGCHCNFLASSVMVELQNLNHVDGCVVFKFMGIGGAEKLAKLYANSMATDGSVLKITTDDESTIHKNDFFDFYEITAKIFTKDQRAQLLAQSLEKIHPSKIYFNNSEIFFRSMVCFGDLIGSFADVFCGVFNKAEDQKTKELIWIVVDNIEKIYCSLKNIVTDNQSFADQLIKMFHFDRSKVICNYVPTKLKKFIPILKENGQLNVFWASRVCQEKRPDVLLKIVEACKDLPIKFHIFGAPIKEYRGKAYRKLKNQANAICYGSYKNFLEIANPSFDLLLYTSETDGLPNVIAEAMSLGYPVIAPDIGGITEIVTSETGFIVSDNEDYESYVKILKSLINNKKILYDKQNHIRELLETKFCEESFVNTLKKIGLRK